MDKEILRQRLLALGCDVVGFAQPAAFVREPWQSWLEKNHHADMEWLVRTTDKRLDPSLAFPGVQTVIVLGVNYLPVAEEAASQPFWAKYALYTDYHETLKDLLKRAGGVLEELGWVSPEDYRGWVDTGPVLERGWAGRSGLGWQGKNAMMLSREHGNWLLLAVIYTTLSFPPDAPLRIGREYEGEAPPMGQLCGSCTRCLTACPTGALHTPGQVDARLCISYHTIENRGVIPRELRAGFGTRLFGCDICLDVCPWNRFAQVSRRQILAYRADAWLQKPVSELLGLSPEQFSELFRKTPVKRPKWKGFLRNACVVAGNFHDWPVQHQAREHLPSLQDIVFHHARFHPDPLVRSHAVWAAFRLDLNKAHACLIAAGTKETDRIVLEELAWWRERLPSLNSDGPGQNS